MPKEPSIVLLVGNCGHDEAQIKSMLDTHFTVEVESTMYVEQALGMMRSRRYDLVLFNRLIFADDSQGIDLLMRAKADAELQGTPIMMVSNFPQAQAQSQAAGGEPGFGKDDLTRPETATLLSRYLQARPAADEG